MYTFPQNSSYAAKYVCVCVWVNNILIIFN